MNAQAAKTIQLPEFLLKTHPAYVLAITDLQVFKTVYRELRRQQNGLEMIASENFPHEAVLAAAGTVLTNKYAEGYPGRRYYGGCEHIDEAESLAIERAKKLFDAKYANVQPHSGTTANQAALYALMNPGEKILSMDLDHGGHLSHGASVNATGSIYQIVHYGVDKTGFIDYAQVMDIAKREKPKVIVAGGSAYPRIIDFKIFRGIADETGAYLLVDMAHFAGLVAAKVHPSPINYAHVTTTTTHKTLRGPRGGMILLGANYEMGIKKGDKIVPLYRAIDSAVFPGMQGGPLEHIIAAKAVAFKEALNDDMSGPNPSFVRDQAKTIQNAKSLADFLLQRGYSLSSNGTDTHLVLVREPNGLTGKCAQFATEKIGITINKNKVPYDARSAFVTSGIRIGTPAITTREMGTGEIAIIGQALTELFSNTREGEKNMPIVPDAVIKRLKPAIDNLCRSFPLYEGLMQQFEFVAQTLNIQLE